MGYTIISERLGTLGAEYDALGAEANGINVQALVDGGLLAVSTSDTAKPAKTNNKNTPKD